MSTEQVNVTFKLTSGKRFDLVLSPSLTVREAKALVEPHCEIAPQQQRYIFKGRILKDDETLESYKISSGNTIHLVKGRVEDPSIPTASASTPMSSTLMTDTALSGERVNSEVNSMGGLNGSTLGADGLGGSVPDHLNPQFFQSLMSNSMVQSVMQEIMANPEFLRNVIQTNPFLNQVAGSNPLLQSTLSNPEFLRSAVNPSVVQAIMNLQQTLQNQNSQSGMTAQTCPTMGNSSDNLTSSNPLTGLEASPDQQGFNNMNWQNLMGRMLRDPDVLRQMEAVFQNVQGNSDTQLDNIINHMFMNSQTNQASLSPAVPPETRYQLQLQQLEDMGFIDKTSNLVALQNSGGDVNAAIAWLLEGNNGN